MKFLLSPINMTSKISPHTKQISLHTRYFSSECAGDCQPSCFAFLLASNIYPNSEIGYHAYGFWQLSLRFDKNDSTLHYKDYCRLLPDS